MPRYEASKMNSRGNNVDIWIVKEFESEKVSKMIKLFLHL